MLYKGWIYFLVSVNAAKKMNTEDNHQLVRQQTWNFVTTDTLRAEWSSGSSLYLELIWHSCTGTSDHLLTFTSQFGTQMHAKHFS